MSTETIITVDLRIPYKYMVLVFIENPLCESSIIYILMVGSSGTQNRNTINILYAQYIRGYAIIIVRRSINFPRTQLNTTQLFPYSFLFFSTAKQIIYTQINRWKCVVFFKDIFRLLSSVKP